MGWLWLVAAAAAVLAALAWYALVRPVEPRSGVGVIAAKSFEAARDLSRYQAGGRREDFTRRQFRLPDRYRFVIRLEPFSAELRYAMEATAGEPFQVGQKVRVRYEERGIPPFWKRIYVREMSPTSSP